ncbi:spore germination protein (amino acid permease) [Paenibacillus endophyticus]|uniref:Spore germination protein (Amino acid permease) n=1 Tax=Paenibacillus endophyticus TaxID=1294268 RepID=A0A7W5GBQ5_9BACL|nr:endospore germination permease [Paenibacillus endophyticus]MBB3153653.1 spore germination protein (amino acid permease) [Paenibacillus endophyticus]
MNRRNGLISIWLSFSILLLSAGLVSHVMSIPLILGVAKRDSWLSVICAAPFFLLWVLILFGILKQLHGERLPDWLERQFGIVPSWIFRLSAVMLLFVSASYTLHDTSAWTVATYMQQTPFSVVIVTATVVSMLAAYAGLRTIAMTSSILLPLVIVLGYFVSIANTKYKDYSLLFPILEHGPQPAINGMFYALAGLMELWVLLLFQHQLRSKMRWWHLMLLALFMLGMVIGPTIGAITEFGPLEAAKQRHTAFEQWKIVNIGKLLQHVDFLSIYQWLCGSFARIAISLYLMTDMLNIRKPRKRLLSLAIFSLLITIIAFYPWRDQDTLAFLTRVYFPVSAVYVTALTFFLAFTLLLRSSRKEKTIRDPEQ